MKSPVAEALLDLPPLEEVEKVLWYEPLKLGHFHLRELGAAALFLAVVGGVLAGEALTLAAPALARAWPGWARAGLHLASAAGLSCIVYGILIEPYRLTVTTVRVRHRKLRAPLRVLQLGDLHVRRWSRLEDRVVAAAKELAPDLIVLTGDYSAVPGRLEDLVRLLRELTALAPVCAGLGNAEFFRPVHERIRLPGLTWLADDDAALTVRGSPLRVYGLRPGSERNFWQHGRKTRPFEFSVALYHFPDFVPKLDSVPYDLLLSGHTHGGQVRLPFVGALVSLSRAGTRYAQGVWREGAKTAVVTRGVGCESFGLPRARFLCPPEVVLLELGPED